METINAMIASFLPYCESVTLVGGGDVNHSTLEEALTHAPNLVAADGGADRALALGHEPQRVVGDMDSVSDAARAALGVDRFQQIDEQDSTDFDKALRSLGAPLVIGVGFLGRRLDHELACLNSLVRHADRPCVLLGEKDLCFHLSGELLLSLPVGMRLSLFPMAGMEVWAEGLVWSFEGLTMAPWDKVGTSNEVAGPVRIRADRPGLLVMLPRAALAQVVEVLTRRSRAIT